MNSTATAKVSSKTIRKQQRKKHRQQKLLNSSIATHASFLTTPSLPTASSYSSYSSPLPTSVNTAIEPVNLDEQDAEQQQDTSTIEGVSAAVITGVDPASTTISNASTNKATHIAGPIVGVFAGVAFIATAMFLVVRNRKKRQLTTIKHTDDDSDKFQDISLADEAITIPPLLKHRSILSTTTDYYSLTDTLIGSVRAKKQQSWHSSIDNRLSDVVSPSSTLVGHHINSFLMVAERQQLQHERPSILDHFDKRIETYKAQLADIDTEEEEEEPLPFITISNLNDYYHVE